MKAEATLRVDPPTSTLTHALFIHMHMHHWKYDDEETTATMTSAVFRSTPSLSIPQSQNTAPVLEFNCLYTHDVRKKQKKWQDGVLRYHTFNKRVMVYDVPRNLVGDMHWTGDDEIQEGDELSLERSGVMVEVADCIGRSETDLTELRKSKKISTTSAGSYNPSRAAPTPSLLPASSTVPNPNTQLKHRSLNALLGTPKGPVGKAILPTKSPFEQRRENAENERWEDGRPPKRPRTAADPGRSVPRTTKSPKAIENPDAPLWARTADSWNKSAAAPDRKQLGRKQAIDLSDDVIPSNDFLPGLSDDALADTSSPAREASHKTNKTFGRSSPPRGDASVRRSTARSSSPAIHAQKEVGTTDSERPPASAPRRASLQAPHDTPTTQAAASQARKGENNPSGGDASSHQSQSGTVSTQLSQSKRSGQVLRLGASAPKKKTLLCQDQLTKKPKRLSSTNTDDAADTRSNSTNGELSSRRPKTAEELMAARLAKINKKGGSTSSVSLDKARQPKTPIEDDDENMPDGPPMDDAVDGEVVPFSRLQTSHEASAIKLARLDQAMLPPARPPIRTRPPSPPNNFSSRVETQTLLNGSGARTERSFPESVPAKADRPFQRAISDSNIAQSSKLKRRPGAPMRYTPSPTKRSREGTPASVSGSRDATPVPVPEILATKTATTKSYKPKRPLQKSVSLNVTPGGTSAVILGRQFQAPGKPGIKTQESEEPKDLGPWSREAFDLFNFRPPGWDEGKWCVGDSGVGTEASNESSTETPPGLSGGVSLPSFTRPTV